MCCEEKPRKRHAQPCLATGMTILGPGMTDHIYVHKHQQGTASRVQLVTTHQKQNTAMPTWTATGVQGSSVCLTWAGDSCSFSALLKQPDQFLANVGGQLLTIPADLHRLVLVQGILEELCFRERQVIQPPPFKPKTGAQILSAFPLALVTLQVLKPCTNPTVCHVGRHMLGLYVTSFSQATSQRLCSLLSV